jgi:ATP-binding cassette subfamily B protein
MRVPGDELSSADEAIKKHINERSAQLLILDEPTAALDAKAEHDMYMRFHELTEGKMTVLISHRFSTVKIADRILLLENGKICEDGTHDELMALNGSYANMYKLQAEKYS